MNRLLAGVFLFMIVVSVTFSSADSNESIADYTYFYQGIQAYNTDKFSKAEDVFLKFDTEFSQSDIIKETLNNYYLGKTYFQLQQYDKAIATLKKTDIHKNEVDFLIAESYLALKDSAQAKPYLLRYFSDSYHSGKSIYAKKALKYLAKVDQTYQGIYEMIYDKNFDSLEKNSLTHQEKIANYFFSLSDFKDTLFIDNNILNHSSNYKVKEQKLKCYYYLKRYDDAIEFGKILHETNDNLATVNYFVASSYMRQGDLKSAISWFLTVPQSDYSTATERNLARLYYLSDKYEKAIPYLLKFDDIVSMQMLISCYEKSGDLKAATERKQFLLEKVPKSDLSAEIRYELYQKEKNPVYLEGILTYNANSYYYEWALKQVKNPPKLPLYPLEKYEKEYEKTVESLRALTAMSFEEGAKILLKYSGIKEKNSLYYDYLRISMYEQEGKYSEAMDIANDYYKSFSDYQNLVVKLYPQYFKAAVEKAAKDNSIEPALIFSVIEAESDFNVHETSSASAYGLMQLTLPTARDFDSDATISKLLEPEYNIALGAKQLNRLSRIFKGDVVKIVAGYNAGIGNVKKWEEKDSTLKLSDIPYTETQNYVQKVINNYDKYSRFYYEPKGHVVTYLVE